MSEPLRIISICTMNICRSPVAEELLRRQFEQSDLNGVVVTSGGIKARLGAQRCDVAQSLIGNPEPQGTTHQVTEADLSSADLVLTADRRQRDWCIELYPDCAPYAFTLREAARAIELLPDSRGQGSSELILAMNEVRANPLNSSVVVSKPRPFIPHEDDIADPHVVGFGHHKPSIDLVASASDTIAKSIIAAGYGR